MGGGGKGGACKLGYLIYYCICMPDESLLNRGLDKWMIMFSSYIVSSFILVSGVAVESKRCCGFKITRLLATTLPLLLKHRVSIHFSTFRFKKYYKMLCSKYLSYTIKFHL